MDWERTKEEKTKKSNIFSLEYNTIINQDILNIIRNEAYTRIPVIKDGIVIGIINSKTLIGLDLNIENNYKYRQGDRL